MDSRHLVAAFAVITALALAFVFMRPAPVKLPAGDGPGARTEKAEEIKDRQVSKSSEGTVKPYYSDASSMRIAKFTPSKKLEKTYDLMRDGHYDKAMLELNAIGRDQATSPEDKDVIEFTKAQIYFTNSNFVVAREIFEKFIKDNPNHPLVENAQKAIEFMDNYEKYKNDYRKFEDEIKKGRH